MVKNRQAVALGMLLLAFLYLYIVSYEDAQEKIRVRECVEQAKNRIDLDQTMSAVMIKGRLYYDTGMESPQRAGCGVRHGSITSTVGRMELPTKDDQSNFGTDYTYCFLTDAAVVLYLNETGTLFVSLDEEQP